jgi:hypothetical protein
MIAVHNNGKINISIMNHSRTQTYHLIKCLVIQEKIGELINGLKLK